MKSLGSLCVPLLAVASILSTGCTDGGPALAKSSPPTDTAVTPTADTGPESLPAAPPLRNEVGLADHELAYQALVLMGHGPLGAKGETCSECHSLNQGLIESWRELTVAAEANCFSVPPTTREEALAIVDCTRQKPDVEGSSFHTPRLGIYSGAAHLDYFDFLFDAAHGDESIEQADFVQRVSMPRPPLRPWSQGQFDIVAEWFARGTPFVEDFLPGPPPAGGCVPDISSEVAEHVDAMATDGWRAVNESNGMLMFGCAGAEATPQCLQDYPATAWGHLPGSTVRLLRTNDYASSYWTRSSADGRFVGHGGSSGFGGSTIVDLATDTEIGVAAQYDPAFFPDNSAFMFQATSSGTGICDMGLLTSGVTQVTFAEAECGDSSQIGLYQHVGAALGGGDYWTVHGAFVSDDEGHGPTTENLEAWFDENESITLTPMVYTGSDFAPKSVSEIDVPFEGDTVISRSSELLISRLAGEDFAQSGYVLRKVEATPNGDGYLVEAPIVATYCLQGGKPDFSYDERWMVLHRYVTGDDAVELGFTGPDDPGFASYRVSGAANLYLVDLRSGLSRRITAMQPGEYALFPHFRSDGWIYFVVRTMSTTEYIAASDAALLLED